MRAVGQSYVQFFNGRHRRTGTLWHGRLKSCLVESDRYALMVCRYIELNPVRAAMVALPEECRGSSVHSHVGKARDPLITPHSTCLALAATWEERAFEYGKWLSAGMEDEGSPRYATTLPRSGRLVVHDFRLWSRRHWAGLPDAVTVDGPGPSRFNYLRTLSVVPPPDDKMGR